MAKANNEDFKNSTKYWIIDNTYVDGDVKVRDHCHITGKYRRSTHRNCNINVKLNHVIKLRISQRKNYDSHLIMQEVGKFNLKINVMPNGLKKYMSFSTNIKLNFINSSHFLFSSLESLVKNLNKNDFKYLSEEFDSNVLDIVK